MLLVFAVRVIILGGTVKKIDGSSSFTGAASDGIIVGRHFPSLIKVGDFMNVIASIVQE